MTSRDELLADAALGRLVRGLPKGSRIEYSAYGWYAHAPTGRYEDGWPIVSGGGYWPTPEEAIRAALEHKKELEAGG